MARGGGFGGLGVVRPLHLGFPPGPFCPVEITLRTIELFPHVFRAPFRRPRFDPGRDP
jgi:hypothetical protein